MRLANTIKLLGFLVALSISSAAAASTNAITLFNGRDLAGWKITPFKGHGEATVGNETIFIEAGTALSGLTFTNAIPTNDYEITLDAERVEGEDFFCGLTFPIAGTNATLIVGGWGGSLVGISSLDELDASENLTATTITFENNRWYHLRLLVNSTKISVWIDEKLIIDVPREDHAFGLRRGEISLSCPLGIATYKTKGAIRNLKLVPMIKPEGHLK